MSETAAEPLVDVGIPAHGRPVYLGEAIECVFAQTMARWRLTISEDGPGDGPVAQAVQPYLADPRVRYVATGERVGAARNMSSLLAAADAPYVALLHDDDRWEPEFLARRVGFLEAHPACGFVFSADSEIDENGNLVGRPPRTLPEGVYQPDELLPRLLRRNLVSPPTLLARRSAYESVGAAFDERFPTIYDYEMILRLSIRFPAGYLAVRDDAAWRRHGHQSSIRNYERTDEYRKFFEHVDALLESERPHLRLVGSQRRRLFAGMLRYMALNALEQGDRRSALSQLGQAMRLYPPTALDPRVGVGLLTLPFGRSGRRALQAIRWRLRRLRLYGRL
jgi:glycosyltransferase involved in cell wall biosynthesis